jgi:hypothetical protein
VLLRKVWWLLALSISGNIALVSFMLLAKAEQDACERTRRRTNVYLQGLLASTLAKGYDPQEVSVQIAETIVKWSDDSAYRSLHRTLSRSRFTRAIGWEQSCVDGTDLAAWWLLEERAGGCTLVACTEGSVTKHRASSDLAARFQDLWLIGQSIVGRRGFESDDFLQDGICSAVVTVDHNQVDTHFTYGIVPVSPDSTEFVDLRELSSALIARRTEAAMKKGDATQIR